MPFSSYQRQRLGHAEIAPAGDLEAGSYATLRLTYTAGHFGIDDTGAIKFSWRTASDAGKPQFSEPAAPGYSTAAASNGATLAIEVNRNNLRPWVNTLFIRVARGFLRAGDRISVTLGDRSQGSPGIRLQTACEQEFYFKTFVDAFSTYDFVELPQSPKIRLVPGPVARWKAILPTLRRAGEPFRLALVAEDRWGNPTDRFAGPPHAARRPAGRGAARAGRRGRGRRTGRDRRAAGRRARRSAHRAARRGRRAARALQPVADRRRRAAAALLGRSARPEQRDRRHQQRRRLFRLRPRQGLPRHRRPSGNDFQIEDEFWAEINRLSREYDKPGEMVAVPGYEWSGNTGMGGDRNVFFAREGRPIRRSSSVLLAQDAAQRRATPRASCSRRCTARTRS